MAPPMNYPDKRLGPAAVLREDEIRALLATFARRPPCAIRNRAIVLLLWRTGLRVAEAVNLEMRDLRLDDEQPTLRVRDGKQGNQRTVGIHQEAVLALERWFDVRTKLGLGRCRYVFCTISSNNHGQQISPTYIRKFLTEKARKAGLGRVHPHAFRATLAVALAQEGIPLPAIRDVLGHSNISTTDAYLRRVFPEAAITAVIDR